MLGSLQELLDNEVKRRDRMDVHAKQSVVSWTGLEVRRLLGCGTFGRVRLVIDKASGNSYALKVRRRPTASSTPPPTHPPTHPLPDYWPLP